MNGLRAAVTIPHEFAYVTVTERERGREEIKLFGEAAAAIVETGVFDQSTWDNPVFGPVVAGAFVLDDPVSGVLDSDSGLGGDGIGDLLQPALHIIASGSFPDRWEDANEAQRRQHRDAQIFEAHARTRRHVLVTNDATGFVRHGKREKLEALGRTRILLIEEFLERASDGTLGSLVT